MYTRLAPKIMTPALSVVNILVIWQFRLNIPPMTHIFCCLFLMIAAKRQSNKMAPDMKVRTKQRCVTEFLYDERTFMKTK